MSVLAVIASVFGLSLAGGFAPRLFHGRLGDRRLQDLTAVASGLLLASALLVVIPEGFHLAAEAASPGAAFSLEPVLLGATILAGFAAMLVLEGSGIGHAVHEEHHDHARGHGHGHIHHPTSLPVVAVGLSVHAMADGLAVGSAAVAGDAAFSALVALAVILHRVPAAFSLGLFALHEARTERGAVMAIASFALATPIMAVVAYVLLDGADESITAIALLFSAGTFVYVATVDTLPAIHNPELGRRSVYGVLTGAGLFAIVLIGVDATGIIEHAH